MLRSNEQWLATADEFYAAAVEHGRWYSALEGLAAATGSRCGELITIGCEWILETNVMTNIDPAVSDAFVACRGAEPAYSPRVAAGAGAPILKVLAEADFMTPEEHATHPHYKEFARPWDIPYICLTTLDRTDDLLIGLAVLRTERQGHISSKEREVFASLAPHVRAAVRMQIALEGRGATLIQGTLESLSIPAFVCGSDGCVRAMTTQAEALVRENRGLTLTNKRLRATLDESDKILTAAIARAVRGIEPGRAPAARTVIVHGPSETSTPLVLDVMSLPFNAIEFRGAPRAVIVARGPRGTDATRAAILQGVYGLTPAETEVALKLAQGHTADAIAANRGVAVGTVRVQIKSTLAKLGVGRQVELVAKLSEF